MLLEEEKISRARTIINNYPLFVVALTAPEKEISLFPDMSLKERTSGTSISKPTERLGILLADPKLRKEEALRYIALVISSIEESCLSSAPGKYIQIQGDMKLYLLENIPIRYLRTSSRYILQKKADIIKVLASKL